MELPISVDLLEKRREIPVKLAELSYLDPEKAVTYLREWGEKTVPVSDLHSKISKSLDESERKVS